MTTKWLKHFKAKMYLKHLSAFLYHRFSLFTPQDPLYIMLPPYCYKNHSTFDKIVPTHLYPSLISLLQTDRQMNKHTTNILVAPDILHHSTILQTCATSQSKVILTLVNSTDYPVVGLKYTLRLSCFGYHKYTLLHTCLKLANIYWEI